MSIASAAKRHLALPLLPLLLGTMPGPACGQTVDYTAAEQLFGEPVTTSVTGKPQRASDVPAEMDIVTADDISRSGASTIPDVLRFVAGVDVRQYGEQDAAVGIRGYNTALNPRVLVLLDGRQVYEDDYGLTVWPLIPVALSAIRQIEIIKGPTAALYGFNAVSGVINIITYDPLRDDKNVVFVQGGSQSQAYGEAVATAQVLGRFGIRLTAQGFRSNEFQGSQGDDSRLQPHSGNIAVDARLQLARGLEWDLSGSVGSVRSDYYVDIGSYAPLVDRANSLRSRLSADTALGLLQLDAYRNENRNTDTLTFEASDIHEDVTVVQASDLFKLGDHTLRLAAEYRDNTAWSPQAFNGRVGYKIGAGSAMWSWQITQHLSWTNAIRVDDLSLHHQAPQLVILTVGPLLHDTSIVEPSFNSGFVFTASDYDTIRLTAARAIQLPSLLDFGTAGNYGPVILAGNSSLQPAAVTNYEIDYDRALPALSSTLRAAAFIQRTDTTIGSPFASGVAFLPTGQLLLMARNFGSSEEAGGEITLKGSDKNLRWSLSYALAAVHDDAPDTDLLTAPSISYQRQTPASSVVATFGYSWQRFDIDAAARWQSRFQDFAADMNTLQIEPVTVSNYVTLNGRLGYRVTNWLSLSLTGEQLDRQRQIESAGVETDRRLLAGLRGSF